MILSKTKIPANTVRRLLNDLEANSRDATGQDATSQDGIRAPFSLDLDSNHLPSDSTSVEHLAGQLEENIMLRSFTNFFDEELN